MFIILHKLDLILKNYVGKTSLYFFYMFCPIKVFFLRLRSEQLFHLVYWIFFSRDFKVEFQDFNAKYFQLEDSYSNVKKNLTELKKQDGARLNNLGGDLRTLMNNMQVNLVLREEGGWGGGVLKSWRKGCIGIRERGDHLSFTPEFN